MAPRRPKVNAIEKLPAKLLVQIMSSGLEPDDVMNLTLTCKKFRDVARDKRAVLAQALLRNHCGTETIPMAIAHVTAAAAPWKPSKRDPGQGPDFEEAVDFCICYLTAVELDEAAMLPENSLDLDLRSVRFMCSFHDASLRLACEYLDFRFVTPVTTPDLHLAQKAVYLIAIIGHILHSRTDEGYDTAWDVFSRYLGPIEKVAVMRMLRFLWYRIQEDKPLGGRSIRKKKAQPLPERDEATPARLPEEYRPLRVDGLPTILAHGMEYLIMPASSYRTRRNNRPMYTIRINRDLRQHLWSQAEVGMFNPEEPLTERSSRSMREWQPRASSRVPASDETRQMFPLFRTVPGPEGFPHIQWLAFSPEAYRRLKQRVAQSRESVDAPPSSEH
ncbi:hypothetical protein SLS62_001950 [Diatrype stigma]|uniref:F-box domain-containing protein n=1 Tax=Diatrype stigma TaxID=117547 RepID=A0AAN9UZH9_9PEZI